MDVKPKSNKLRRLESKRKLQERDERRFRVDTQAVAMSRARLAHRLRRGSESLPSESNPLLRRIAELRAGHLAPTSDLYRVIKPFADINLALYRTGGPVTVDMEALSDLVFSCQRRTSLFRGNDAERHAHTLLALSAHSSDWIRQPEDWKPRSLVARWQLHALARHLFARYDVPVFMNGAWLEGLTAQGVVHQKWFIHVAQGQNIRTADGLLISLTKKQAHYYLQAPDDFDVISAFRWAQILDLGGSERLVRSVLGTRLRREFADDAFWISVFRWLIAHPTLDSIHYGPIIDYLQNQRFVATVPNPSADLPGQPRLVPRQPNLTIKDRDPETLLRSIAEWHQSLAAQSIAERHQSLAAQWTRKPTSWTTSGIEPFRFEETEGETRRIYTIAELLCSRELDEEGREMSHCVGTYAGSCESGRSSIWSLKVVEPPGPETRLLTLEVSNADRQIVQARKRFNTLPESKEIAILKRWADAGGPRLSRWLAR
jgi:hypothetical protein